MPRSAPQGQPTLVLTRTWMNRILIAITLVPLDLISLLPFGTATDPLPILVRLICGAISLGLMSLTLWLWWGETGRETRLYATGVEQLRRGRSSYLAWSEVAEIHMKVTKVRSAGGGLVGAAFAAAMSAALERKDALWDERTTNITLRLDGQGRRIAITSDDRGAGKAAGIIFAQVNPRLLRENQARVDAQGVARFGRAAIGKTGVSLKGEQPVPFDRVETFDVVEGALRLKERGRWIPRSCPLEKIPNAFVFMELYALLSQARTGTKPAVKPRAPAPAGV